MRAARTSTASVDHPRRCSNAGPINLIRRRRDRAHRRVGRAWALAILATCLSSFGIHPHGFSWLHGLSVFTLLCVSAGVLAIRRRNVLGHRANMIGSYIGTLIAFGLATFLPDRLISRMAADDPGGLTAIVALILAGCVALAVLALKPSGSVARPSADRHPASAALLTRPGR